ncbi:MAG: UPF0182 family protein, partial [Acidimicrobiia bacterium]
MSARPVSVLPPPAGRPRRPGRWRRVTAVGVVALVVLVGLWARGLATFYTDYLWFRSLNFGSVWTTLLGTKAALAAVFSAGLFTLVWVNLVLADRRGRRLDPHGPGDDIAARYRAALATKLRWIRIGGAAALGLIGGIGMAGHWHEWILLRHHVAFGVADPQFGTDAGFYVFRLPFLEVAVDWLFAALIVSVAVTVAAYYVNGAIQLQPPFRRLAPGATTHLSILLGLAALVRLADYQLQRRALLVSADGVVDGATYTDVHARFPALELLSLMAIVAAGLFFVNVARRGWLLPAIAVSLWGALSVILGGVYPAVIQRLRVEPAESSKERPYIERNITATRAAMGLADVAVKPFDYTDDLTLADLTENEETVRNVRLWDPAILQRTYQRLQEIRGFYQFNDVDVDRYHLDGRLTQVVLSARELNDEGLPSQSWENRHLAYTHGYGAVLSPANAVTAAGQPDFLVKDVPPQGSPEITQPAIYHGERLPGHAIVRSARPEIDYPKAEGELATRSYTGDGGVGIGSPLRRLAFALRLGNVNPLISGLITPESKVLYLRDIRTRVETAAPFLAYDHDPYPVIIDGRIVWIQDAYTTTARYPYAQ